MGDTQALDIARLGAQGDGVADTPSGPVFVPFALSGERVQADVHGERARLIAVMTPSPDRIAPVCRHFTHCGGCAVQHLRSPAYLAWKREMVIAAFASRGIDAPVAPVASVGVGARRRAAFSARRTGRSVVLGLKSFQSLFEVFCLLCSIQEFCLNQSLGLVVCGRTSRRFR